jgi:hypothetical protein
MDLRFANRVDTVSTTTGRRYVAKLDRTRTADMGYSDFVGLNTSKRNNCPLVFFIETASGGDH